MTDFVKLEKECPACDGAGYEVRRTRTGQLDNFTCRTCQGQGFIPVPPEEQVPDFTDTWGK